MVADAFDTMTAARKLKVLGMPDPLAEGVVEIMVEATTTGVATKADLQAVRVELKADLQAVRVELNAKIDGLADKLTVRLGVLFGGALLAAMGIMAGAMGIMWNMAMHVFVQK